MQKQGRSGSVGLGSIPQRYDMSHKKATSKRASFTKLEREYVKAIVYNLSFQRITDQEIVQWFHDEKQIDLNRSTISKMRKQVESKAEKWYIELKRTSYKYIAAYKERLDSLFSYQKKLHEIIHATMKDEVKIRAISELHSIEMDIFNLWKQLPNLDIVPDEVDTLGQATKIKTKQQQLEQQAQGEEEYGYESTQIPPVDDEDERRRFDEWNDDGKRMSDQYRARMEAQYGITAEPWDQPSWVRCATCSRWFKNQWHWINHHCIEGFKKVKPGVAVG
jgi:hypothetical protein